MATFTDILKSAFTDTASLVHVTPKFVKVDRTPASHWDIHLGSVRASNRLTALGSVALSRLPVSSEEELLARKKRILEYDFSERWRSQVALFKGRGGDKIVRAYWP